MKPDMTHTRTHVPDLVPDKCTGCGQCWIQCPEAAIPGLVTEIDQLLETAVRFAGSEQRLGHLEPLTEPLSLEVRSRLAEESFRTFADMLRKAYAHVAARYAPDPAQRRTLDQEFARLISVLVDFPVAKTSTFYTAPEMRHTGSGGLLSITVNPDRCTGCGLCVAVCPEGALLRLKQDQQMIEVLGRNWSLWKQLPDTPDRFVSVRDFSQGIGVLHTLLLKRDIYDSMRDGINVCSGCGERTALRLITAVVEAATQERLGVLGKRLETLIRRLGDKADSFPVSDLSRLDPFKRANPLFHDSPSIALESFDGQMRKMASIFRLVREAELKLDHTNDPDAREPHVATFDWRQFTDEEFLLCPPTLVVIGDGAMRDSDLEDLTHALASGKPLKVIILNTQTWSSEDSQTCTGGLTGHVPELVGDDLEHVEEHELPRDLSSYALAQRTHFVLQTSQALPSHFLAGVLRGLASRHPAVFNIYSPCPPGHGIPDDRSTGAARLALESRTFPFFIYDPDGGPSLTDRLDLQGNPALQEQWPTFELVYRDEEGSNQTMTLPVTVADWAATERRFSSHFSRIDRSSEDTNMLPFHEYLRLSHAERRGKAPFVYTTDARRHLDRLLVSDQMVRLAEDRLRLWSGLKELAGVRPVTAGPSKDLPVTRTSQAPVARLKRRDSGIAPTRVTRSAEIQASVRDGAMDEPAAPAKIDLGPPRDPHIDSALCTTCKECTNINPRMFAYDKEKRAIIKDPRAGTFKELVRAAELCPPRIIHPGTPLDPTEKDLEKWLKRAKPFE